ncbi:MAG: hypothetical protein PHP25_00030 [Candidatus Moranbacteria bacterium]|nr:hypothetical protein [Candidatus Moranbacteria bacterium]
MFKKLTATILLLSFLSFALPRPARAGSWGEDLAAAWQEVTLTKMLDTIEKTLVANLKIMAIRVIQGRMQVLLTGSCGSYCIGGSSGFITDWQDYIFGSAQRTAENTVNTFFNGMRSGVGSGMERVVNNAQKRMDADVINTKSDLANYVSEGKATLIFDATKTSNSWVASRKKWEPQNDEAMIFLYATALDKTARESREEMQKTEGVAGKGFLPTRGKTTTPSPKPQQVVASNGKIVSVPSGSDYTGIAPVAEGPVTLPPSLKEDIMAEVYNMGTNMITFAKSIPEVVANMVAQTLTNVITYGIRQVTDPVDKAITDTRNKVGTSINQAQSDIQSGMRDSIYFNNKK